MNDNQIDVYAELAVRGAQRDCHRLVLAAVGAGGLASLLLSAAVTCAAEPENLAPRAKVSASSEYDGNYAARFAIDGQVPDELCRDDAGRAWAINRKQAGDQGEFILQWDQPVDVAEIIYFGRTGQVLSECWKDFDVYQDEDATPVARGTLQMVHGPQRIAIPKRRVRSVRLKFLNSHGPHNPGASEIAVYAASPSAEQLDWFPDLPVPEGPPWVEPASTPPLQQNPFQRQVDQQLAGLTSPHAAARCLALRNLSLMRAYQTADQAADLLSDSSAEVRCEAAMNLGRTGNRNHLVALLGSLADPDWSVRQAAWLSLVNLTGQGFPFESMGSAQRRKDQIAVWREWARSFDPSRLAEDFAALSSAPGQWLPKERLARALGAIGDRESAVPVLIEGIQGYVKGESDDRHERLFLQASVRSLGRLGGDEARRLLIVLLDNPQWAVYAADALGDVGGEDAAAALLAVLPDYAYRLDRPSALPALHHGNGHVLVQKRDPKDVDFAGGGKAWTPRTAYSILLSLSRIDFSSPETIEKLRDVAPHIVSNMPLDYDTISVYETEPWQPISAWLLDKAGIRQAVVDTAFYLLGLNRQVPAGLPRRRQMVRVVGGLAKTTDAIHTPFAAKVILSACRAKEDVPLVIQLLSHDSHWVRINAAKTLMEMGAKEAAGPIRELLESARDDADYGYFGNYARADWEFAGTGVYAKDWYRGYDEYSDPTPRYKEAFLRALGRLGDDACLELLVRYLNNDRNTMEIQSAAAYALADLATPRALDALKHAEASHPFHNVRLVAREVLHQREVPREARTSRGPLRHDPAPGPGPATPVAATAASDTTPKAIIFIKGPKVTPNAWFFSSSLQAYNQTDEGPTYRVGLNIYKLEPATPAGKVTPITHFTDGYVADLQVSYDGRKILFARRGGADDPWWHVYQANADGTELRQLTSGPYHDVQPNYLPDGRIVLSTSRVGMRDEYHGYVGTALAVMNADGSDLHCIGFNCGRDLEPAVNTDGRILFVRLEDFYSLPKLEFILESCFPDGTHGEVLYGPERRQFWAEAVAPKGSLGPTNGRHRTVCVSQPQPLDGKTFLINSFSGPMIVGPGRNQERILRADDSMAITTPYPIDENTLLCAAGARPFEIGKDGSKKYDFYAPVDHGLYWMDVKTGELMLIYNDPEATEFEARPLMARPVPPVLADSAPAQRDDYAGRLTCTSIFHTQHQDVKERGKYVRIVEGIPMVARHSTHTGGGVAWMNHGGSVGRILGLLPVAPDGSFSVELPADRLIHIQVLDADGYVVGNELNWHYVRPGENKSCIGCHERPDSAPSVQGSMPLALRTRPVRCLPVGGEMLYRAKNWVKEFNDENEERKRTVNALNLIGRL